MLTLKANPSSIVRIGKRLTPSDVHLDRYNTDMLLTYLQEDSAFVHNKVFPTIPSPNRSNYYAKFDKEYWLKSQLALRAPGAKSAEVHFKTSNDTYFIPVIAGHIPVDDQTAANADAPFDPRADSVAFLAQQAMLYKEIEWASTFFVNGVWGTSATPGTLWSAASSYPLTDIETGIYTIQSNTGASPANMKLILGRSTWKTLKNHSDIIARVNAGQTPNGPAMVGLNNLAALLGIGEVLVMGAIKNTADLGQTGSYSFVGGDNDALLVYVNPRPSRMTPTAGVTFTWNGYLGANAEGGRMTNWYEPSLKSSVEEIELAYTYKLIASDLGYFFLNAVS